MILSHFFQLTIAILIRAKTTELVLIEIVENVIVILDLMDQHVNNVQKDMLIIQIATQMEK